MGKIIEDSLVHHGVIPDDKYTIVRGVSYFSDKGKEDKVRIILCQNYCMKKKPAKGKKVSWKWGGKTYYGNLISSMETKTHRFARTENGKIKKLPKKK